MTTIPRKAGAVETGVVERSDVSDELCFEEVLESPHYERLRGRLVRIFARRGCRCPEDLADETIARVIHRMVDRQWHYRGDPVRYFFGVARNVYLEHLREPDSAPLDKDPRQPERFGVATESSRLDCLERCLSRLDPLDRVLVIEYYQREKAAKIDHRKQLASRLGIGLNALRIRVHRIRRQLGRCVTGCASSAELE